MEKYRGNMAANFVMSNIKDLDQYWVEMERKIYVPESNSFKTEKIINCFSVEDWTRMQTQYGEWLKQREAGKNGQQYQFRPSAPPINWITAAGFQTFEVLHDPTIKTDPETLKIKK